jgi:hypothetical protein
MRYMAYRANIYGRLSNRQLRPSTHSVYLEMTSGDVGVKADGSMSTFSTGVSST